jgi:nucleotide-binding universal stress UspA family protein
MNVETILVPTDFSEASTHAYAMALELARLKPDPTRVVLLHVLAMGRQDGWRLLMETPDDIEAELTREAFRDLETARASRDHEGVEVSLRVATGRFVEVAMEVAEEERSALIVCGATGRSRVGAALLGTSAYALAALSDRPTLIVPEGASRDLSSVLAPVDLDARAHTELEAAKAWADALGASLEVVHAVSLPTVGSEAYAMGLHEIVPAYLESRTERLDALLDEHGLAELPREARHVVLGQPSDVIASVCEDRDIALVVIASRCHGHLAATLLGSTATRVLRSPSAPTLVLPVSE